MSSILAKLAALDRPETKIVITSRDGKREQEVLYMRPTLAMDQVLQKLMSEEFENTVRNLKAAPANSDELSVYAKFTKQFKEIGAEGCANAIIVPQLGELRKEVMREQTLDELTPLPENASEEEKASYKEAETEFMDVFKPAFDARIEAARKTLIDQHSLEELAEKAATLEIEKRARTRAWEMHQRNLVAKSVFDPATAGSADPTLIFEDADQVAAILPVETIRTIANRVIEELDKVRNLPLS